MAIKTTRPLFWNKSLIQAKQKITGRVSRLPIAARAFALIGVKPRSIMILGVYVVSGLHVENTHPVAMK